ncbi:peptidylprolyl isomerase [Candidatus Babeliales bacterium]|nr:peptidylprolyl isomerase [Candidatus Babeliales bacterium]
MKQAKSGDMVKVHYTGKLDNGTIFDSSEKREPLQFKIGEEKVIPGFEKAVIGMSIEESKTIKLMPEESYGPHRKELIVIVPKKNIPGDINLQIGQQLQIKQENGHPLIVIVIEITEDNVTLDANHPLAGKDLTFEIKLVEINE